MGILSWVIKMQWAHFVDYLTYERQFSAEKVLGLFLGTSNLIFISLSVFHHYYWAIPLIASSVLELRAVMTGKDFFMNLIKKFGFVEKAEIHKTLKRQLQLQQKIEQQIQELKVSFETSNKSNEYCFTIEDSSIHHS